VGLAYWHEDWYGNVYWTIRGEEEFRKIYGRQPFSLLSTVPENFDAHSELAEAMKQCDFHWGEARLSPATIAALFSELEAKIMKETKA
jgi:hypothetical protein